MTRAEHASTPCTIKLSCPLCGKRLRAPAEGLKARAKVLCRSCGHVFRVGETNSIAESSAPVDPARLHAPDQIEKPASLAAPLLPDLPSSEADQAGRGSERSTEPVRRLSRFKGAFLVTVCLLPALLAALAARITEEQSDLQQAVAFWTGTSGHIDFEKAHYLLTQAANTGDPVAKMWIAVLMNAGQCDFEKDRSKAYELASSVVDEVKTRSRQQDPNALYILGVAEQFDLILGGTQKSGFEKIREAAALEFPDALNSLGDCYRFGRGTDQVLAKAVAAFRQAADLGHVKAQKNLAWCYREGCGVEQDQKQAIAWYAKAAQRGDEWSQQYLAGVDEGSSDEGSYEEYYDGSTYAYDASTYTTTPSYQSPTYPSYQTPAYTSFQSSTYAPNNSGSYLNDYERNAAQTIWTNKYTYGSNSTNGAR
jgi:hypothetical protein